MKTRPVSAKKLLNLEKDLNKIFYNKTPIGGLFSRMMLILNRNDHRINDFNNIYTIPLVILKSIKNKKLKSFSKERNILLGYSNNRVNFKELIVPLKDEFPYNYILYGPVGEKDNNTISLDDFPNLNLLQCLKVLLFSFLKFRQISKKFKKNEVHCSKLIIFNNLFTQLTRLESANLMIDQFKIVIVDSDRHYMNTAIILAANTKGIKTVTLVHGMMNPIYGYNPILADEIWCWGEFDKNLLIDLEVAPSKIKIIGNPIIRGDSTYKLKKNVTSVKDNCKANTLLFTIGLVLERDNREYIKFVETALVHLQKYNIKLLIKPHPFTQKNEFDLSWMNFKNVSLFDNKKSDNYIFFEMCDLVITKGSSMSFEAPINDTPVCLIDLHDNSQMHKNIIMMNRILDFPKFEKTKDLSNFIEIIYSNRNEIIIHANKQKLKIEENVYYKTGKEATLEISKCIREKL